MATSKERAEAFVLARIEKLKREIPKMKENLEGIVDEETALKCIESSILELKMLRYLEECIILNHRQEPIIFNYKF